MSEKTISKGKYYSEKYGTLRTIYDLDETKALFCAKDVAKALGYTRPSVSVRDICMNCVKEAHMTDGGLQVLNFIGWDDIARLYYHCRNREFYPYIEYLCEIEDDMFEKARTEAMSYSYNAPDMHPYEDVYKNGTDSEYCCGDCEECNYLEACKDYCRGNCDICPLNYDCNSDEMQSEDSYGDNHRSGYNALIKKIRSANNENNIAHLIVDAIIDLCCEIRNEVEQEDDA